MPAPGVGHLHHLQLKCPDVWPHSQTTPPHDKLTRCNAQSPRYSCSLPVLHSGYRLAAGGYNAPSSLQQTHRRSQRQYSTNQRYASKSSRLSPRELLAHSAPPPTLSPTSLIPRCSPNEQEQQNLRHSLSGRTSAQSDQMTISSSSCPANLSTSCAVKWPTTLLQPPFLCLSLEP